MTKQVKRENIIRALENCNAPEKCRDCPWEECEKPDCKHSDYPDGLIAHAIALLKAQEPKAMTSAEVGTWMMIDRVDRAPIVVEVRDRFITWVVGDEYFDLPECDLSSEFYGKTWRCWNTKPSKAEMEAEPWDK